MVASTSWSAAARRVTSSVFEESGGGVNTTVALAGTDPSYRLAGDKHHALLMSKRVAVVATFH